MSTPFCRSGFATIFAVVFICLPAFAQTPSVDAPLGLAWGVSASEIQAQGTELKEFPGSDFGKSFVASKMERALADQSAALLSFGFNDKLWRVVITGRSIS